MLHTLCKRIGRMSTTGKIIIGCGVVLCLYAFTSILHKRDRSLLQGTTVPDDPLEFEVSEKPMRLVVATRVHMKSAASMPDPIKVLHFIQNTKLYADGILICVGADDITQVNLYIDNVKLMLTEQNEDHSMVTFLPVIPWGYFTTALNAAILFAQDGKFDRIAFQSLEVSISQYEVHRVLRRLSVKDTIVVGPVLEGHEFLGADSKHSGTNRSRKRRSVALTGRTVPWNTFAVWRVRELALLGFPLVGDGTAEDRGMGGVEELTAITMLQKLNPSYTAVLLQITPPSQQGSQGSAPTAQNTVTQIAPTWDTTFADPQRQAYHDRKMQSKNSRPAAQLKALGIEAGTVLHEVDL